MNQPLNIFFTSEELKEFGELYLEFFGEEINQEDLAEQAEEYVEFIYQLTNAKPLVRYNNTALVTNTNNSLNDE